MRPLSQLLERPVDFPRMTYRAGGPWVLESGAYSLRLVADADDLQAATADGWHLDQYAARDAAAADAAQPTRAELEQKAAELSIKVDGRWSDRKLRDVIAAALGA
mgnify:FL=1